ncbi:MAG: ATP-binding protein, partial [Anaerolineae bacterium]|nr:ATP-binding protein [Anaerolineae bacterium]
MDLLSAPLRVLVVAPQPRSLNGCPPRAGVEAFYEALEAQGDQLLAEWLYPAELAVLKARIESLEEPPVHLLYLEAPSVEKDSQVEVLFEGVEEGEPVSFAELELASRGLRLAIVRLHPVGAWALDLPSVAQQLWQEAHVPLLLLAAEMPPARLKDAVMAFLTGVLSGQSLEHSWEDVQKALRAEGFSLEGKIAFVAGEAEAAAPLVEASPQAPGVSKIIRFPSPDLLPPWRRLPVEPDVGGLPAEPPEGFVGREDLFALLERALRAQEQKPGWVYGYEGLGKSTLLAHLARWLVRTGRFEQVVYTSFANGGLPEQALRELAERLLEKVDVPPSLSELEKALSRTPTLILWDNLEALLPEGEFPVAEASWRELLELGERFSQAGGSRVCFLSDTPALPEQARPLEGKLAFALEVGALDEEAAGELMARLLSERHVPLEGWEELASLLRHPLALEVQSALGSKRSPQELIGSLGELIPGLHAGEAKLRNQALEASLTILLQSFEPEEQLQLQSLGLFAGGFVEPFALRIVGLDDALWAKWKEFLSAARVLHEERLPGFSVPYIHFHPAWARFLARHMTASQREKLESEYCGGYLGLLTWLAQIEPRSAELVKLLARRELGNLRRALQLLLSGEQLSEALTYVRYLRRFLEALGLMEERELVSAEVEQAASKAVPSSGPLGRPGV